MGMVRRGAPALLLALVLVGTACGGSGGDTPAGGGEQAAAAPAEVEVMVSEFKIEPADIQVPAGQDLQFTVMNHGSAPHTFAVVVNGSNVGTSEIQPTRRCARSRGTRPWG